MSRQRRLHPKMVVWDEERKTVRKLYHNRQSFQNWMITEMLFFDLPRYQETKYRGTQRWYS